MCRLLLCLLALAAFVPAAAAQDKKPVRLFAEAEDFEVRSPGWKVMAYRDNYYASTFAVTFLSRMGCLSAPDEIAPGKKAVAEQAINIPYEDTFELLVRYEQPFQFALENLEPHLSGHASIVKSASDSCLSRSKQRRIIDRQ